MLKPELYFYSHRFFHLHIFGLNKEVSYNLLKLKALTIKMDSLGHPDLHVQVQGVKNFVEEKLEELRATEEVLKET